MRHFGFLYMTTAALAAGVISMAPAYAQRASTPAEQDQTRSLNSQAATTGEQDEAAEQAYQDAQKKYQEQKQSYDDKRQQYEQSKDTYDAKKGAYEQNSAQYKNESAAYNAEYPDYGTRDVVQLGTVAPRSLLDAPVESLGGDHIGHVVRIKHHGRDMTIEVDVGGGRHVTILADALRYDRGAEVIVTPETRTALLAANP